jgi:hypothetical protein
MILSSTRSVHGSRRIEYPAPSILDARERECVESWSKRECKDALTMHRYHRLYTGCVQCSLLRRTKRSLYESSPVFCCMAIQPPPRARRSPPDCLLLGPRFSYDLNICRRNVTEGVARLRYTCSDQRVAWCLDEVEHKCSTGETIAGRSVDPGWAHSLRVPKSKRGAA